MCSAELSKTYLYMKNMGSSDAYFLLYRLPHPKVSDTSIS